MAPPRIPFETGFWSKVNKTETCWIWTGCIMGGHGYGALGRGGRGNGNIFAHRASWELHFGSIPEGLLVLHSCDNPRCVNPDHLFLGTHQQNMDDMVRKHRQAEGVDNGRAVLTEDDVRAIRALPPWLSQREIATVFGVSKTAIRFVQQRKSWDHVT